MPPKPKNQKEWSLDELGALIALAARKGINKKVLAEHWLGVHPVTLSYWISATSPKEPPVWAKKLLSCIEPQLAKLPDDE